MTRRYLIPLAVATVLTAGLASPAAAAADVEWRADLSTVDADDNGVTTHDGAVRLDRAAPTPASARAAIRTGFLQLEPRTFDAPVNAVAATVKSSVPAGAEVAVDVRGAVGDEQWTEWVEARPDAPAVLPTSVTT